MPQVERVELEQLVRLGPPRLEVRLHVGGGVDPAEPDVPEVALEHGPQLGPVEQVKVERVLEVRRLVRGQHAGEAVVREHPGQLGDVRLRVGEVLDEVGRAHRVEAGGPEGQVERVHLGHPQAVGPVAGGGGRRGLGRVVDAHDLAPGAEEAGRLESLPTADVEDAPLPMRSRTAR